ncbi:uncharacterized protein LOC129329771 [Eublepharis macularius]|uniref:Uncharacterized protein LOC129329771 n=1 Tax=Eublepharis macularius TaxID=481883 RepID=A0AA97JDY1_EUBMA|nr:uncharacterized protein LOC129329771 [Eublepharis macularius]
MVWAFFLCLVPCLQGFPTGSVLNNCASLRPTHRSAAPALVTLFGCWPGTHSCASQTGMVWAFFPVSGPLYPRLSNRLRPEQLCQPAAHTQACCSGFGNPFWLLAWHSQLCFTNWNGVGFFPVSGPLLARIPNRLLNNCASLWPTHRYAALALVTLFGCWPGSPSCASQTGMVWAFFLCLVPCLQGFPTGSVLNNCASLRPTHRSAAPALVTLFGCWPGTHSCASQTGMVWAFFPVSGPLLPRLSNRLRPEQLCQPAAHTQACCSGFGNPFWLLAWHSQLCFTNWNGVGFFPVSGPLLARIPS